MQARSVVGTMLLALAGIAWAADDAPRLFREGQFSEDELVRALTPLPEGSRTRSISATKVARPAIGRANSATAPLLITFDTNSSELGPAARSSLDVVGRALASDRLASFTFSIEGHADPRGGPEFNQRLSQARAESVVDYLAQTHQIARERLQPIGRGDSELLKPTDPTAPENRRVTIKTQVKAGG